MARRTSRAASYDQASSPPTTSRHAQVNLPKRTTRSTRSQSRDLDEPYAPTKRSTAGRTERQSSVDNVASDDSAKNTSRRKNARGVTPIQTELSMVAEGEESEGPLEGEDESPGSLKAHYSAEASLSHAMAPQRGSVPQNSIQTGQEPERSLLPAARIRTALSRNRPVSPGKSLYISSSNVHFLLNKTAKANAVPPSNQQQLQRQNVAKPSAPRTPQNNATRKLPWTAPPKTSQIEGREADQDKPIQDDDDPPASTTQRIPLSTQEMAILMMKSDAEKNKENRPLHTQAIPPTSALAHSTSPQRKSFIDRQANAHRVTQIGDSDTESQPQPTAWQSGKRMRHESTVRSEDDISKDVDDDVVSEDGGFEQDLNELPDRMRNTPPETIHVGGTRKRIKVFTRDAAASVEPRQPRIDTATVREQPRVIPNGSREQNASVPHNVANDGVDMEVPMATYREVRETAQLQAHAHRVQKGGQRACQTRVKWSEDEADGFLSLIKRYGCSWAVLLERGTAEGIFHGVRNQGSLKDKARNMKVDFLVSCAILPKNFDNIALSQKERDKVISKGQNPYRKEGERVGEEMLDMYGNPRDIFCH